MSQPTLGPVPPLRPVPPPPLAAVPPVAPAAPPVAPAAPRSRAGAVLTVVVSVLLVIVVGGAFAAVEWFPGAQAQARALAAGSGTPPLAASTPSQPPARQHTADLATYAVAAPPGSHPWKTHPADERLNLAQAAALTSSNPTARSAFLSRYGFQRGFARYWVTDDGMEVMLRLYQLGNESQAEGFFAAELVADRAGKWGEPQDIDGSGNGETFEAAQPDSNGFSQVLSCAQRGDVVAVVIIAQKDVTEDGVWSMGSVSEATLLNELNLL